MEILHSKYVFASVDKAANNVIIFWFRHILFRLFLEMGLGISFTTLYVPSMDVLKREFNSTSAYVPARLTKDKLRLPHIDILKKINVKIDKSKLPTFY